jgi:hypothetical protein
LSDLAGLDRLVKFEQLDGRISPETTGGHHGMGSAEVDSDKPGRLG